MKKWSNFTSFTKNTTHFTYPHHTHIFHFTPCFCSFLVKIKKCISWRGLCEICGNIGNFGKVAVEGSP